MRYYKYKLNVKDDGFGKVWRGLDRVGLVSIGLDELDRFRYAWICLEMFGLVWLRFDRLGKSLE